MKRLLLSKQVITKQIMIGNIAIGAGANPVVQSMTNTDTSDVTSTLDQITRSAVAGARFMRVAVPDNAAVEALTQIVDKSPVPIVADIHFDYRLALASMKAGVHKLRINPGNIGSKRKIQEIILMAKDRNVPIRVGVNSGSLESSLLNISGHPTAEALAESALRNADILADMDFNNVVLSIKGSDIPMTVEANKIVAGKSNYPIHIGITEAGTKWTGSIRSSVGLSILLAHGIGDTLRVSLAADPVDEIRVAYRILESLGIEKSGPTVIACPTCGRTRIDVIELAEAVENALIDRSEPLTVAVMGCAVNGPGEAREADLGIAGGKGEGLLFRKGKPVGKVAESDILKAVLDLFDQIASE